MNFKVSTKKHINKRITYWLSQWGLSLENIASFSWRQVYKLLKNMSKIDMNFLMKKSDLKILAKTLISFDISNLKNNEQQQIMENFLEISLDTVFNKPKTATFSNNEEVKLFDLLFIKKHPLSIE